MNFNDKDVTNLTMWLELLLEKNKGVSFNVIVYLWPAKTHLSDVLPRSMGGFLITIRKQWRLLIPRELVGNISINLIE